MNASESQLVVNDNDVVVGENNLVVANTQIITPQHEQPEPFSEPDWSILLNSNITHLEEDNLISEVEKL